jgi:hypothetical protein
MRLLYRIVEMDESSPGRYEVHEFYHDGNQPTLWQGAMNPLAGPSPEKLIEALEQRMQGLRMPVLKESVVLKV